MARIAAWEFGESAVFDGTNLFAEIAPENVRPVRSGTLEMTFTADRLHRSTLFAHGVPGRDPGAFTIVVTHAGAVALSCTERGGTPLRVRTQDGFVAVGEQVQVTLSSGLGGAFSVVNCTRKYAAPENPDAGFVAPMPLRTRFDFRGTHKFTFGAASGGVAPFFHGRIHVATLSDTVDAPTVSPPSARILEVDFRSGTRVMPRRVAPKGDAQQPRPSLGAPRRAGQASMSVSTAEGDTPLSRLKAGAEVLTRDGGFVTVQWVGRADLDWKALRSRPHLKPVVIRKGAFGDNLPEADMALLPHHRVSLPKGPGPAQADEIRPVAALVNGRSISPVEAIGTAYIHFHARTTELVQVNGLWIEALSPHDAGPAAAAHLAMLAEVFPDLPETGTALPDLRSSATPKGPGNT